VGDGKIVGVDDEKFGIAWVAETFGDVLRLRERGREKEEEECDRESKSGKAHQGLRWDFAR
jgi:hypothetical protein